MHMSDIYLLAGSAKLGGQPPVFRQAVVLVLLQGLCSCVATEHMQTGLEPEFIDAGRPHAPETDAVYLLVDAEAAHLCSVADAFAFHSTAGIVQALGSANCTMCG